jgi:hypothetical protein
MSTDPNASGPYAPDMPPAKSGGSKVWLFLGVGCGVVVLLCCGGGLIGTFVIGKNSFQMTQDPAEVRQKSSQIADFDVPEGFQPKVAVTMNIPFTGQKLMSMAVFAPPDDDGGVFLTELGQFSANADREQMRAQMEQQMKQQGQGPKAKQLNVLDSHDIEVEINGKPATFKIQKAEDPQTKKQYVQVDGVFDGKGGPGILIAQLKSDDFSEEDAEAMVRSIK